MNPRAYFVEIVQPLMALLRKERQSVPLIYACTMTLYHVVDYLAVDRNVRPDAIRSEIIEQFPDFTFVYALATAQKHSVVRNKVAPGLGSKDIQPSRSSLVLLGGKLALLGGRPLVAKRPVVVSINGKNVNIFELLVRCELFFAKHFASLQGS